METTHIESRAAPAPFNLKGRPLACARGAPLLPLTMVSGVNREVGLDVDVEGRELEPSFENGPRDGSTSLTSKNEPMQVLQFV